MDRDRRIRLGGGRGVVIRLGIGLRLVRRSCRGTGLPGAGRSAVLRRVGLPGVLVIRSIGLRAVRLGVGRGGRAVFIRLFRIIGGFYRPPPTRSSCCCAEVEEVCSAPAASAADAEGMFIKQVQTAAIIARSTSIGRTPNRFFACPGMPTVHSPKRCIMSSSSLEASSQRPSLPIRVIMFI